MIMEWEGVANDQASSLNHEEAVPDIAELMNDWFFGSVNTKKAAQNLTGERKKEKKSDGRCSSSSSGGGGSTSVLTQEWLEEAKKMVEGSPSGRLGSPARLGGSPRFASSQGGETSPLLDRRDPLSRSARRRRAPEGVGDEILLRSSARHSRSNSECFDAAAAADAGADHNYPALLPADLLPPKQPKPRRTSRFRGAPLPAAEAEQGLLSPPRNLLDPSAPSAHRRSASSSTCSLDRPWGMDSENGTQHHHHRHHRRAASSASLDAANRREEEEQDVRRLNAFLKRQRAAIEKISRGEVSAKAKIILSQQGGGTSSIVAAICYAWLLANSENGEGSGSSGQVAAAVVNIRRERMLKNRQAAWLLYHVGVDASALLFADEVNLEGLIMARQVSVFTVGEDVLKTNGEAASPCTILTDNYCEEAYNLLQSLYLKKLLLAGILLDTQNLNNAAKFFTNRDSEAVQLLSVGASPSNRHELFQQLMEDHTDNSFLEALKHNYKNPSSDYNDGSRESQDRKLPPRNSTPAPNQQTKTSSSDMQRPKQSPASAEVSTATAPKAPETASRGKNKFFLAKWFGFGSK